MSMTDMGCRLALLLMALGLHGCSSRSPDSSVGSERLSPVAHEPGDRATDDRATDDRAPDDREPDNHEPDNHEQNNRKPDDRCRARVQALIERPTELEVQGTSALKRMDGWHKLVESGYRLHLPARGPIRFPIIAPGDFQLTFDGIEPLVPDTPYTDGEIADKLADAIDRASMMTLRDCAMEPLYIMAEPSVDVTRLQQVLAIVPVSMAPRLVIGTIGAAVEFAGERRYFNLRAGGAGSSARREVGELACALAGQ